MTSWFVRLTVITLGTQFIVYSIRPLISYQALAFGASPTELGLITASFSILSLAAGIPLGRGVDRWREVYFVAAGTTLIVLVTLLLIAPFGLVALGICSASLGLGHLSTVVGAQTLIAKGSDLTRRDRRFATFTIFNSLGQLLGPAITGLLIGDISATGPSSAGSDGIPNAHRVLLTAALVGLVIVLVATSLVLRPATLALRPTGVTTPATASVRAVMGIPSMPTAMLSSLTVLASIDILAAYLPAYGEEHGISVRTVGLLLAVQGTAAMASRIGMLWLIATFTRRRLLAGSMIMSALGLVSIPLLGSGGMLFAAMAVIGFGLGLGQPVTLAWVAARAPREVRGTAMSIRLTGNRLGQTTIPAVVGSVAGAGGLAAGFISPALLLLFAGALVLRSTDIEDAGG